MYVHPMLPAPQAMMRRRLAGDPPAYTQCVLGFKTRPECDLACYDFCEKHHFNVISSECEARTLNPDGTVKRWCCQCFGRTP